MHQQFDDKVSSVDEVDVFFTRRPSCNFDTIAYLQSSGGFYSLDAAFLSLRKKAAQYGAAAIYITHTERIDIGEYLVSAQAIRCDLKEYLSS